MNSYEIIVTDNKVTTVKVPIDGKMQFIDLDDIIDLHLIGKIDNLKSWLKIYPLGDYIFNEKEYQDFKEFMLDKRYEMRQGEIEHPLMEKANKILNKKTIKGYEKLNGRIFTDIVSNETKIEFFKTLRYNDKQFTLMYGCPNRYGLDNMPQDSHECLNDYCGQCWKNAVMKDYVVENE